MENTEQPQYFDGRIVVTYDKDQKKATFYDTYLDINGDIVRYDDIAVFQSNATDSTSNLAIYYSRSFSYNFTFTTYDGTKHELSRLGYSSYGIGSYKRVKADFEAVSKPMYEIVLMKVFARLIDRIDSGATVNICGLQFSKDKIVVTKKKEEMVIDRNNFGRAEINRAYNISSEARIYLKGMKRPSVGISLEEPNARLIVPTANYLFRAGTE